VVGGSQGSRAINEALLRALSEGARLDGQILWATGPNQYESVKSRLGQLSGVDWVIPIPYIIEMPKALAAADVALSRAGAMATAELLAWGIPMLLIPLPTAAADHQTHNARALAAAGAAHMLLESELTGARLWEELTQLTSDAELRQRMALAARERARPNAACDIAQHLAALLDER
jgi:UDP-N-acetylglucosamine--N-acetylmuramyl-(pentapeptide) pyrophosphoryl-undecaprenol N-acetylglucosamine transferase